MQGQRIRRLLVRIPSQVCVGAGLSVLAATLVSAALLPGKELAVAVAVVGTFTGTALLSLFLPKLLRVGQGQSREGPPFSAGQLEAQRQAAEARAREAERELARLEALRINLAAFQPILKLGLLEVETNVTDFQQRPLTQGKEEAWWRNGYRQVYVGVVQVPVKAHLGIDLQQVRVHQNVDGQLVLSGLRMITMTDTVEGPKWLLDEVRTEYLSHGRVVKFKGDPHDPRSKAYSREQELELRGRLKQGQDFAVFEAGLIRTAEQLLRVLLSPLGRQIVFQPEPLPESRELLAYLSEQNRQLEAQLALLRDDSFDRTAKLSKSE